MTAGSERGAAANARPRQPQRSPALFFIPLFVIAGTAWFCIATALHRGEPYLQIAGHYAPVAPVIEVGSGPRAGLRLTESEVEEVEGWLRPFDGAFSYDHASPTSPVDVVHSDAASQIHRAVQVESGDTIEVVAPGRHTSHKVQLFDGLRLTIKTARGDYQVMLPESEGASVPLGDSGGQAALFLSYCDGHPVWSKGDCTTATLFPSYFAVWMGRVVDAPPPAGAPRWTKGAQVVFGTSEHRAYMQVDGGALTLVPTPIAMDMTAAAAPFVLWKRPGSSDVYVSRGGAAAATTIAHLDGKGHRTSVGSAESLPYSSVLVLGATAFRVTRDGQTIRLQAVERRDRFHFFPSLSAGRLNFTNRVRRFTAAAGRRLQVIGVGARKAPPPVEATTSTIAAPIVWPLQIPAWFRGARGGTPDPYRSIPLAAIELTPDGSEVRVEDVGGAMRPVKDDQSFDLGGHILEYHHQVPQLEQIAPTVSFAIAALLIALAITHSVRTATPLRPDDPTADFTVVSTTAGVSLIAAALIAGVSLMSHMAAVDTLIGKTDYYHRQLFYSFVALSVLAAILIRDRWSQNPLATWRTFFPVSIGVLAACAGLLVVWQLADWLVWIIATRRFEPADVLLHDAFTFSAALALTALALFGAFVVAHPLRRLILIVCAFAASVALWYFGEGGLAFLPIAASLFSAAVFLLGNLARAGAQESQSGWRKAVQAFSARYQEPAGWQLTLAVGIATLMIGAVPGFSSGRGAAGVKPAEFAVWFVAAGLAALLTAEFRPTRSTPEAVSRRDTTILAIAGIVYVIMTALIAWALRYMAGTVLVCFLPPFAIAALLVFIRRRRDAEDFPLGRWLRVFVVLIALQLVITVLYAAQGDFGPLLVLSPTVALVVLSWSLAPDRTDSSPLIRAAAPVMMLVTLGWLFGSGALFIKSPWAGRIAMIEGSIARASKRLLTFTNPWFTKEGSWGVSAQWLANDYFGAREPMIANLHSDLAFIAALRTFGTSVAAFGLMTLYLMVIVIVMFCAWVLIRNSARTIAADATPQAKIADLNQQLHSREAAFLAIFASFYLMWEILFHIGSGFNAVPQTGVTLPWLSSGGSAAVAFAGLFGIVFSRTLQTIEETA